MEEKNYLVICQEGTAPLLDGPLDHDECTARAKALFQTSVDPDNDHLYWLVIDSQGIPHISGFSEDFIDAALDELYSDEDDYSEDDHE